MNLWFKQILPYLALVIFHLNSSQVDHQATAPSGDQPANPPQALYHPPGAPFGPVHFTKYLPNPVYVEYKLETILIANPLASTRETEYIGRGENRIEVPPLLFKDKYNYLPAYFVPMTPPLTLQPNCPMETPTTVETMSTQLFGVLYITLTAMIDTMVPNSGPWSLLGQSVFYIIKLSPILWWTLPSGLTVFQPKPTNTSTHAWIHDNFGHFSHLTMVTVHIGSVIAGHNLGVLAYKIGDLFPFKWVPDTCLRMYKVHSYSAVLAFWL
ncbi:hypothetical protein DSO57_1025574 [Entomophthora muscae]|uniref:Uncharacterized protein n=1 Tax=Entomophthora muscae TaxID=34485 RepID=A0ACC2SF65_9FUNG|nr:hypothetical protein DSO57_1025574 [Entomophthora muscae]